MSKIEIKANNEVMTLINLFNVEPKDQEELINILKAGAANILSKQPGYISSSVHRSKDGKHAVVYSQWQSQQDFEAVRKNPAIGQYFARLRQIAQFEPLRYEVSFVHHI
jgi:heme-degrading monooxygenase HmoA